MAWTANDVEWVAARLSPEIRDINQEIKSRRITRRLRALYIEIMKIRITEDVFFLGQQRHVGDVMDVQLGPYRTEPRPGGLRRIPQFVEMAEETNLSAQVANARADAAPVVPASAVATPAPGTFAEATAAVIKPAPAPAKQASATIGMMQALTARRMKLHQATQDQIHAFAKRLDEREAAMPKVFEKANAKLDDEIAAEQSFDDSLNDFAGANGVPLPD